MNKRESIYSKKSYIGDAILKFFIYFSAFACVFVLGFIIFYILSNGMKYITIDLLTKPYSENNEEMKGILPMIINTFYIIIITLIISVPIGISAAIYMTQYAKQSKLLRLIRFTTEVLSGIPSIIFGLFGFIIFCGMFRMGTSILSGCLTMTLCILPTIIRTTEESLLSVPEFYKEGALALGAGKFKVIMQIVLPCALPGIITSIILAIGRIVGESAALLYTSGMAYNMPNDIFSHIMHSGRTLTLHLFRIAKQADTSDSLGIAFAISAILLILVFLINIMVTLPKRIIDKRMK